MSKTIPSDQKELVRALSLASLNVRHWAKRVLADMEYDLTHEQIVCLLELGRHDGLELGQLAKHMDRERTTVTRMIDGLEKRNLVVRVADRGDKRNRLVYLTKLGKKRVEELEPIVQEFYRKVLDGISQPNMEVTLKTLQAIIANTDRE